ncbi:MAG: cation:proton antiporter [Paraprevotella sp.]|nr:cation:proton antiporter [Paraprevotella sp.]
MNQIPALIQDLALILLVAAVVSLLFKWLKQPVVLGYIVAGFIASSHFKYFPSVRDVNSIDLWAQIGVIILLFTLGLEFSFKKILKMGAAPVIAALTIIFCMMFLGTAVGHWFGLKSMDGIYLGGMLAMSSTTIIYKAFQDLGILQKKFAGIVLSVLILEDILAIVLIVMLSTLAVSHNIEGSEMVGVLLRLGFFLILWFVGGLYLIPIIFRRNSKFLNSETLLIISLALCFIMAVVAVKSGFSAAFGAFVVGSILAETVEAERIEKLVAPVKDLFGAIFFVSVGMLVDPHVLVEYAWPIVILTLTIIVGQAIFGTFGFVLAGQQLKDAMKCGFSMSQIGEFAFIIATMGTSLGVTSNYLYPIVVAVSVVTTFTTPYMLKAADPAYAGLCRLLPHGWVAWLERYTPGRSVVNHSGNWNKLISGMAKHLVVFTILSVAVIALSFRFFLPFLRNMLPHWWANEVCGVVTLIFIAPFLRGIMARGNHSPLFITLWKESRYNRLPLIFTLIVRVVLICMFIFYIIRFLVPFADPVLLLLVLLVLGGILLSRPLRLNSIRMEKVFMDNLHSRDALSKGEGAAHSAYVRRLLSKELHLADFEVPEDSIWGGRLLGDLNFGQRYEVHVASIIRGTHHINIPNGNDRIYPGDHLQVIGTDEQIGRFSVDLGNTVVVDAERADREMQLRQFMITADSGLVGKKLRNSGIREQYHCMIVGFETPEGALEKPDTDRVFASGDIVWLVGEKEALAGLPGQTS